MEIVIDIPEEIYIHLLARYKYQNTDDIGLSELDKAGVSIKNGTPLPEGHGDLIDRDSLELDSDWSDYYDGFSAYSESQVRLTPTIIEGSDA